MVKLVEYPNEPYNNSCELGNRIYSFEDIQNANRQTANTVNNITTGDDGSISPSAIKDALDKAIIAELDVASLNALEIRVGNIEASYIKTTELVTVKAEIQDAVIQNLQADNIFANYEEVNVLKANVETVNTLLAGTVTTGSTQTIVLNSKNTTIENALIKSAMIESLDVSKINSGTISTNKFTIQSNDGAITIADSTMQFKDNNDNVRIQMGQDASGNFSFIIRASDGQTTLIDGTGVKENAIADKLIKTNMINDKAITKDKIDYTSFVEGYNASTNTNTIKASKVLLDGTEQTLDVKFNTMQSTIDNKEASGRNYIRNSNFVDSTNYWYMNKNSTTSAGIKVIDDSNFGKALQMTVTGVSSGGWAVITSKGSSIEYKKDSYYTVSFFAKSDGKSGAYLNIDINNDYANNPVCSRKVFNLSSTWTKYTYTFKALVDSNGDNAFFRINQNIGVNWIANVKLEKGTEATLYNQAFEDIDKLIKTNSTSINAIQGQISTLISQTSQINDNKNNIATLTSNYSSLNQTVNSLNTTVSSHTSSISSLNTTVTSHTSSINQLQSSIALKVESSDITAAINGLQIGGANIVINGNFKKDATTWYVNRDSSSDAWCGKVLDETDTLHPNRLHTTINSISSGGWVWFNLYQNNYNFVEGKTYTLSFLAHSGTLKKVTARVSKNDGTNVQMGSVYFAIGTTWTKCVYTFKAKYNASIGDTRLQFTHGVGTVKYTDIKLEEGDKATGFTVAQEDIEVRFSSVEQQITSTAITTKISTGLSGTDSISNTYFTMDNKGLTIKNGGIKILNNANTEVLACDTNGDLTLKGTFASYSNNKLACKIEENQYKLYDFSSDDETYIGALGALIQTKDNKVYKKIGLYDSYDSSICIGYDTASEANNYTHKIYAYMQFDSNNSIERVMPIEIFKDTGIRYGVRFAALDTTNKKLTGFFTTDEQDNFVLTNYNTPKFTNYLRLGTNVNYTNYYTAIEIHRQGDQEFIDGYGTFTMYGDFTVTGNKNCLQQTENYGGRLFYSLEDCSSYLTDRVDVPVQVEENKQIKIAFNEIFKECVNLTNYQITINKESYGDYTILEKTEDYFILKSDTEGFKFTYTITAKRRGYEDRYLDEFKTA